MITVVESRYAAAAAAFLIVYYDVVVNHLNIPQQKKVMKRVQYICIEIDMPIEI